MHAMLKRALATLLEHPYVRAYMRALDRAPFPTKVSTSGTFMLVADVCRQALQQRDSGRAFSWDTARTARFTAFSLCFHAPFTHVYHPFLERSVWPRLNQPYTAVKVAFDQIFVSPFTNGTFLAYTAVAEGRGADGAWCRVAGQLPVLWRDSLCVWGPAHVVTFNLPVPVRVLWQDVVRLYFGTLMSLRASERQGRKRGLHCHVSTWESFESDHHERRTNHTVQTFRKNEERRDDL